MACAGSPGQGRDDKVTQKGTKESVTHEMIINRQTRVRGHRQHWHNSRAEICEERKSQKLSMFTVFFLEKNVILCYTQNRTQKTYHYVQCSLHTQILPPKRTSSSCLFYILPTGLHASWHTLPHTPTHFRTIQQISFSAEKFLPKMETQTALAS